jgi:hypothetical protein
MSEPFVVHLPKTRTLVVALVNVALTAWALYLVATWHSAFVGILGIVLLVVCAPIAAILIRLLVRNEPVLTVTDAGIEAPGLGAVEWFEITSLKVEDRGLLLTTQSAALRVARARMDVKAMPLRAAIETRGGGSWLSGQWASRES